jgi:5-methylcytosine-specific restriction protein A
MSVYGRRGGRGRRGGGGGGGGGFQTYRTGYLRSVVWFRRRARWLDRERTLHGGVRCTVCHKSIPARETELHHLDYSGVQHDGGVHDGGGWVAGESHADLVACHRRCHEWIHKMLDRDAATADTASRRAANLQVIARLHNKIASQLENMDAQQ